MIRYMTTLAVIVARHVISALANDGGAVVATEAGAEHLGMIDP